MGFPATELVLVAAAWLSLIALTAIGAAHRGQRALMCVASGVLFPLAWAIWYVLDERATGGRGRSSTSAWRWSLTRAGRT